MIYIKKKKVGLQEIISGVLISLIALFSGVFLHYYVDNGSLVRATSQSSLAAAVVPLTDSNTDNVSSILLAESDSEVSGNESEDESDPSTSPGAGNDNTEILAVADEGAEEESETQVVTPTETIPNEEVDPADEVIQGVGESVESGLPNLVVRNIIIEPNPMQQGQAVRIRAFVQNIGSGLAFDVNGKLENITNGYQMGEHTGYNLEPDQQFEFWEENTFPYFAICDNDGENKGNKNS